MRNYPVETLELAATVAGLYKHGWSSGMDGNYSRAVKETPKRHLIMASGVDKGALNADQFLLLDQLGAILSGEGKPSAVTGLHVAIYRHTSAGTVLHTHFVPSTGLGLCGKASGALPLTGLEMLKGVEGINTHEATMRMPTLGNGQDRLPLALEIDALFHGSEPPPVMFLAGHGLYTCGKDLPTARRSVEIVGFIGNRAYTGNAGPDSRPVLKGVASWQF